MPRISGSGARARMAARYTAARDDFTQEVAQLLGGNILVTDMSADGRRDDCMTGLEPPTVQ